MPFDRSAFLQSIDDRIEKASENIRLFCAERDKISGRIVTQEGIVAELKGVLEDFFKATGEDNGAQDNG